VDRPKLRATKFPSMIRKVPEDFADRKVFRWFNTKFLKILTIMFTKIN
jgi:hypothetical protein